jgi:hypothetical protein
MTEPTLTDWHTLFTTVRERFPDAPGLPEGYFRISRHFQRRGTASILDFPKTLPSGATSYHTLSPSASCSIGRCGSGRGGH